MLRSKSLLIIIFSVSLFAQSSVVVKDLTFDSFFIDESTPLPFSPDLSFNFGIPDSGHVIIEVHKIVPGLDSLGIIKTTPVAVILDKMMSGGLYQAVWNGTDTADGEKYIYFMSYFKKVGTIYGDGYIKLEAKCKVTSAIKK